MEALTTPQENKPETIQPGASFLNYLTMPDEIIERMSQLRNYFGLSAKDVFTPEHLEYARAHYVSDTGLDNQMSLLMNVVTPGQKGVSLR